jgi:hypothetical protein
MATSTPKGPPTARPLHQQGPIERGQARYASEVERLAWLAFLRRSAHYFRDV